MTRVVDLVHLVRAPAALSVPGDVLAGAASAGWPFARRTALLPVASVCLYWAGMALNDYADRDLDAVERPERPIPAGKVTPRFALVTAAALTVAGLGIAALAGGRRATGVALPLAGTVWAYDLVLKGTPFGPFGMAAARGLDVLLGAGMPAARQAMLPALTVAGHTLAVTALSLGEVRGTSRRLPCATLGVTALTTAMALSGAGRQAHRLGAAALAAGYAGMVGTAQAAAAAAPTADRVRRAVGAGILGMIPLQAALIARAGALRAALGVAAALPLARRLAGKVSPT